MKTGKSPEVPQGLLQYRKPVNGDASAILFAPEVARPIELGEGVLYSRTVDGQGVNKDTLQQVDLWTITREVSLVVDRFGNKSLEGKIIEEADKIGEADKTIYFSGSVSVADRKRPGMDTQIKPPREVKDEDLASFEFIRQNPTSASLKMAKSLLERFPNNFPLEF